MRIRVHMKGLPAGKSAKGEVDRLGIKYDREKLCLEYRAVVFHGVKLESMPDHTPDYFEVLPENDKVMPSLELKPQPAVRYVILRARYGAPSKKHDDWLTAAEYLTSLGVSWLATQVDSESGAQWFFGVDYMYVPVDLSDSFSFVNVPDKGIVWQYNANGSSRMAPNYCVLEATLPGVLQRDGKTYTSPNEQMATLGIDFVSVQNDFVRTVQYFFGVDADMLPVNLPSNMRLCPQRPEGAIWNYDASGKTTGTVSDMPTEKVHPFYGGALCVIEATFPSVDDGPPWTTPQDQMSNLGVSYVSSQVEGGVIFFFGVDPVMLPDKLPSNMRRLDEEPGGVVWLFLKDGSPVALASPAYPENVSNDDGSPRHASGKDTNPKDAVGTMKWRQYCTVPTTIIWELGVAMLEGARKYGRHNYRVSDVRASVYVDAAKGHIDCYWEGEDIDEDSGLHHITKAMASLAVVRDSMIQGRCIDDRPPKTDVKGFAARMQVVVEMIFKKYPEALPAYLEGDQYPEKGGG